MLVTSLKSAGRVAKIQTPQEVQAFTARLAKDAIADLQRAAKSVRKGEASPEFAAGQVFENFMTRLIEEISVPAAAKSAAPVETVAKSAPVEKSAPVAQPRSRPLADQLARTLGVRMPTLSEKASALDKKEREAAAADRKRANNLTRNMRNTLGLGRGI